MLHQAQMVVPQNLANPTVSGTSYHQSAIVDETWVRSVQLFDSLTRDTKKRNYVKNSLQSQPYSFHKLLLEKTSALQDKRVTECSSWQRRLERALQTINDHACVGDVFVQGQGQAVTFAWGSVRLCLRLATADLTIGQDIANNLFEITELLACAEDRLKLFPSNESIFRAASYLFASALLYVVKATFHLQEKTKPARAIKAAAGGFTKFKMMFDAIRGHADWLDREFTTAAEARSRDDLKLQSVHEWLAPQKQSALIPPPPTLGTGKWLLDSQVFSTWKASGFTSIFCIEGAPGCGKTVLAEHLASISDTELTFLHSCYSSPGIQAFCYATLAWLVKIVTHSSNPATWHADFKRDTLHLISSVHANSRSDLESVQTVLQQNLSRTDFPKTCIIVDAMSECQSETESLFCFLELINQSSRVSLICFSRRACPVGQACVTTTTVQMDYSRVRLEVESYARKRIAETECLQDIEDQILESISSSCSGLFMLTTLLLDDLTSADTLEDQLDILKAAPESLFDRFEQRWLNEESRLTPKQRTTRLEILMLLVVARRPLEVGEISSFLALDTSSNIIREERRLKSPFRVVENLCQPLVSLREGQAEIIHPAVRDFVINRKLLGKDPDAFQAEKCLSVLSEKKYTSVPFAAALLRRHLLPAGLLVSTTVSATGDAPLPYEYAALFWHSHVIAVSKPSDSLLTKLREFITGIAAVTWSESLIDIRGRNESSSINLQIDIRAALLEWVQGLPPALQQKVPLEAFFVAAHVEMQQKLEEDHEEDHLLPYLPAIRLGQYFSIAGRSDFEFQQAYKYKKLVVDGFTKWLGKRSPLTLQARTEFINEFFSQGLILEAEVELLEVVSIEKDVLGTDSDAYYSAMQLLGNAQYYLNKFQDASQSLEESGDGLLRLLGKEDWNYQVNNLYYGWVFEREGDLDTASQLYERIVETWIPVRGKTNGLSIFASTSIGSVCRKKQKYESARSSLEFSWQSRKRLLSINSNTTVDSGLQLALLYWEMNLAEETLKLLDEVEKSSVFENDFERACQAKHIRALVSFGQGKLSGPIADLTKIVDDTVGSKRDQNNRECLWIRITLADALRHAKRDAEAVMLFSELVSHLQDESDSRPATPTLDGEPEPPAQLETVEKALKMVKSRDPAGANQLLRSKNLQWKCEKDFYIRQGGPPADTAWTRPSTLFQQCNVHRE